jgi:hypothetical protein
MANVDELLLVAELTAKSRVIDASREGYNSKIKYCINFVQQNFPEEIDPGPPLSLKLPLSFKAIKALFGKIIIDTDLPRDSGKRKRDEENRIVELDLIRRAAIERQDEYIPEEPEFFEDNTINKANSHTVSKSCLGGYKSALKLHYGERHIAFTCADRPPGSQDINEYLNEQIKSYGNLIADKKLRAVMPLTEGKTAMTEEGFAKVIYKLIKYKPKPSGRNGKVISISCI